MFASKSLTEHLLRGVIGIGSLIIAMLISASRPWSSVALFAIGLISLRGCPTCWTVGLISTVGAKLTGKPAANHCVDGSCSLR